MRYLNEALSLYEKVRDARGKANCHFEMARALLNISAHTYSETGNVRGAEQKNEEALIQLNKALSLYKDLNDRLGQANVLLELGCVHIIQSAETVALGLDEFKQSLQLSIEINYKTGIDRANAMIQHWERSFGIDATRIADTVQNWMRTANKEESKAFAILHKDFLLTDEAELFLDQLSRFAPSETVTFYVALLTDCRKRGINAAYSSR